MVLRRFATLAIACAMSAALSVRSAGADEASNGATSPALIGLQPATPAAQPPPSRRKLWIALGVISGAAFVGGAVALGLSIGGSSQNSSVFHDWGTVTVTRR